MIPSVGPSSPLYLAGNMHRNPENTTVQALQVQWLDEKWGWRTDDSFECTYDHQEMLANQSSILLHERLTAEGKKVRIIKVQVSVQAYQVWANEAAKEHEIARLKFIADYEAQHEGRKP